MRMGKQSNGEEANFLPPHPKNKHVLLYMLPEISKSDMFLSSENTLLGEIEDQFGALHCFSQIHCKEVIARYITPMAQVMDTV